MKSSQKRICPLSIINVYLHLLFNSLKCMSHYITSLYLLKIPPLLIAVIPSFIKFWKLQNSQSTETASEVQGSAKLPLLLCKFYIFNFVYHWRRVPGSYQTTGTNTLKQMLLFPYISLWNIRGWGSGTRIWVGLMHVVKNLEKTDWGINPEWAEVKTIGLQELSEFSFYAVMYPSLFPWQPLFCSAASAGSSTFRKKTVGRCKYEAAYKHWMPLNIFIQLFAAPHCI